MWHRIRWGNVGRLCAAIAVVALVVAWPRLASPPPRLGGDEPVAIGPEKAPARPRARARAKRPAAKRPADARVRPKQRRRARRKARPRAAERPVLGGGMVDARPVAGESGGAAGGAGGSGGTMGGGGGSGGAASGGGTGASLSPPPALPDPATAEFGPEG